MYFYIILHGFSNFYQKTCKQINIVHLIQKLEMAATNEEFTKSSFASFCTSNIYVPQQLTEANELLKSVNRRLEDCALEWQAKISHKQWKIFNSKAIEGSLSDHSLLARTYFSEKHLDETFQYLLAYNKIFSEYLKTFIGK